jgi:hypothetical protein
MSCLRRDPNHCANREGDLSCRDAGHGEFCSACASTNFGCLDQRPDDVCYVAGPSLDSSSGSASGSESGSASGSGPVPSCTLEGDADPSCPDDRPYCLGGECGTCDQAASEFCAELDAAAPVCHAEWGRCVECTAHDAAACEGAKAWCGNDFTCTGCTEHSHCPESACDLERGECMDDDVVVHVSNVICPDPGEGTESMPYCSISTAMQQIDTGERGTVILHGSTAAYDQAILLTSNAPRTIAVLGVDEPTIVVPGTGWSAVVSTGQDLYVSGVRLSSGVGAGVQCVGSGARLWLDDLSVANNTDGVVVDVGRAHLRRVRVIDNDGHGVHVANGGQLFMESTIIANNGVQEGETSALYIDGKGSTIDVRYSTIANNVSALSGPSIYCAAGGGGTIRNSIIVAPSLNSMNCPWAEVFSSVHDNGEAIVGGDNYDVEVFDVTWFRDVPASDFHVRGAANSLFADRARWELGDPILDFDAERRVAYPGASGFAGADEP